MCFMHRIVYTSERRYGMRKSFRSALRTHRVVKNDEHDNHNQGRKQGCLGEPLLIDREGNARLYFLCDARSVRRRTHLVVVEMRNLQQCISVSTMHDEVVCVDLLPSSGVSSVLLLIGKFVPGNRLISPIYASYLPGMTFVVLVVTTA